MKYTLFFLLCSLSAFAQTTTRTFVLSADSVNYLEVTRITAEDGFSYTETARLVGPSNAIANDQADKIETIMSSLAQSAYAVSFANRTIKEVVATDSIVSAITSESALSVIKGRYSTLLLSSGWTIDTGTGTFVDLVFTINGQGNLRYSVNGSATKAATIYGAVLRLQSFPSTGTATDFYISENGQRYFSLPNRSMVIKKP